MKIAVRSSPMIVVVLATTMLLVAGCATTRSISNSSSHYDAKRARCSMPCTSSDPGFEYRGELNEFDVLGIERSRLTTEEEIQDAFASAYSIRLAPGSSILLVQSGAVFPDGAMLKELKKRFHVTPFSGVPPHRGTMTNPEPPEEFSYSKSLRLAAARAGAETVVCCWGILESARRDLETKTVSWVPMAGWLLPDERQHMRIRLKLAIIDVRTGKWAVICPEPFTDAASSTRFTRGSSDQNQVERLKEKAYKAGTEELLAMASHR
jgi:hypothetical protein